VSGTRKELEKCFMPNTNFLSSRTPNANIKRFKPSDIQSATSMLSNSPTKR
jgi:hypothetical protein